MFDKLLEIIFPPVCGFCGKLCKEWICDSCEFKLNVNLRVQTYQDKYFDKHIYIMDYKEYSRESILKYKFSRKIIYV